MDYSRADIKIVVLISITLFILGLVFYGNFFDLITPHYFGVYDGAVNSLNRAVAASLYFCIVLAVIPIFIMFTLKISSITSFRKKIAVVFMVISFMVISVFSKHLMIAADLKKIPENIKSDVNDLRAVYPVEDLNYQGYAFGGLCIACILSFLIYGRMRTTDKTTAYQKIHSVYL